jgi:hypothetical protein
MRKVIAILFTAFLMTSLAREVVARESCRSLTQMRNDQHFTITGPLSVEELEKTHMIEIRETGKILPFGYLNASWVELKNMMKRGDKIYFVAFRDSDFYQDSHLLIRKNCVVFVIPGKIT